jgi:hypothetical protein
MEGSKCPTLQLALYPGFSKYPIYMEGSKFPNLYLALYPGFTKCPIYLEASKCHTLYLALYPGFSKCPINLEGSKCLILFPSSGLMLARIASHVVWAWSGYEDDGTITYLSRRLARGEGVGGGRGGGHYQDIGSCITGLVFPLLNFLSQTFLPAYPISPLIFPNSTLAPQLYPLLQPSPLRKSYPPAFTLFWTSPLPLKPASFSILCLSPPLQRLSIHII